MENHSHHSKILLRLGNSSALTLWIEKPREICRLNIACSDVQEGRGRALITDADLVSTTKNISLFSLKLPSAVSLQL